jgi:hypothetical protein
MSSNLKLKMVLIPKTKKVVKSFGLSEEAIQRLIKVSKKSGLSASEVINQMLLNFEF